MNATVIADVQHLSALLELVGSKRDEQAFERLFDHYAPLLRAYSLAREPGAHLTADELAQEVLVKVWNKAHLYNRKKANANTWIFTLARNCRIDYLRRNGRFAGDIDAEDLYATLEDPDCDPIEITHQNSSADKVRESLNGLPVEQAQVLAKVYLEGKTQQEAALELNLPLGTVKSRVRLALQKLNLVFRGYDL